MRRLEPDADGAHVLRKESVLPSAALPVFAEPRTSGLERPDEIESGRDVRGESFIFPTVATLVPKCGMEL